MIKSNTRSNTGNMIRGIRIFIKQLPQVKGIYLINLFGWTLLYVTMLVPGLMYRNFFTYLETGEAYDRGRVLGIMLPQMLNALLRISLIIGVGYFLALLLFKANYGMKQNLLDMILTERPEKNKFSMGEAINSIKEDPMHVTFALDNSLDFFGKLMYNIVVFFILLAVDAQLTILLFLPLIGIAWVANVMSNRIINNRKKSRKGSALVSSLLGDLFNNIQAIKVNGAERSVIARLLEYGEIRRKAMVKDSLIQELLWNISNNISGVGTALILIAAAGKIRAGTFSTADFVIFNYYIWNVISFFEWVGRQAARFQQSTVSLDRMLEMTGQSDDRFLFDVNRFNLKNPPSPITEQPLAEPLKVLSVKNLTSTYGGENGVSDISFDLPAGEFLVITGRIGSGKSTLLKTLLGVKSKDSGEVLWNGQALPIEQGVIPPQFSYTSQTPSLFSESIKDNILLGHERRPEVLERAFADSVLNEDLQQFEQNADTLIGTKGVKLSGGQKQRVAIARMLAHEAEVFVLDDVSSALDVDTELKLWERIGQRHKTRIAVSNRHVCLKNADKVLVLKDGKMEAYGPPAQLLSTSPELKAIWGEEVVPHDGTPTPERP
ncbi:ABC transporter ATP-binding protein [Proteiniclasticum sp. QWL-01]|uniref:ABC transporter ATP-binding protein n=1 Tax=Proteiniclasticum sp. QWL-01 TaxID=3036945 RepID=UPI00240F31B6|nr:ABC transporter ATP-binding protein [Proteiniclasticum sp. QWL-01]WFF73098.1 ABC transporter ATP-binding protein [Proteiniclasticum sp. QWL-01]